MKKIVSAPPEASVVQAVGLCHSPASDGHVPYSTSYEITPEELIVRWGPVRLRFQLSSITDAIATRVPLGPALQFARSSDMVHIKFRPASRVNRLPLAISPANQTELLRELAERVPGLTVRGEGNHEKSTRLEG
jgi:hypothetical protein